MQKPIGAFTGIILFFNAGNEPVAFDKVSEVSLVSSDTSIGTVDLPANSITFTGNGIMAGTITLTLTFTNDKGDTITATLELTFLAAPDTTAVRGQIAIN